MKQAQQANPPSNVRIEHVFGAANHMSSTQQGSQQVDGE